MKSRIQSDKRCFFTGSTVGLDRHHIFFGPNRTLSEEDGLWVYLRHDRHVADSPHATPHNNRDIDLKLKRMAQEVYEREIGSREEFMERYGRNYL